MFHDMDAFDDGSKMGNGGTHQDQSESFGIRKIVDVKVREDGKQMYKVKWEPTWEPVENLASCQHLIDEFWSFVNKAKTHEGNSLKIKQEHNFHPSSAPKIPKLSIDDKSDVQRLIARTNQTPTGNPTLMSPNMLFNQQNQQMMNMNHNSMHMQQNFDHKPTIENSPNFTASPSQKNKVMASPKTETFSPGKDKISSNSSLKYIEHFDNPYVKIILVCRICNKEQSLKFAHNWKRHYLSHEDKQKKKQQKTVGNPTPAPAPAPAPALPHPMLQQNFKAEQNNPMNFMY